MRYRRPSHEGAVQSLHLPGYQRRQRSVTSNNSSSISTKSPPWTLTQRPQELSTAWPEDDQLTVDGDPSTMSAVSSWQEEAHWMSFRNAVQYFATLTIHENSADDTSSANYSCSSTSRTILPSVKEPPEHDSPVLPPPPVHHVGLQSMASDTYNSDILADHDDLLAAGASIISNFSTGESTNAGQPGASHDVATTPSAQSSKLASELAETKMRLALAQAERDELEFALMMGRSPEASSPTAT